mgnify:CR=1 FL=1
MHPLILTALTLLGAPDAARFACLAEAYPEHVEAMLPGLDGRWYVHTRGGRFLWDDGQPRTAAERLEAPDLQDTLALPYPTGASNGFIWGGRWFHYDTMHFEYRPELLHPVCVRAEEAAK